MSRYFGGTLLGAGGLVRAYSDAVRGGLQRAGVVQRQLMQVLEGTTEHAGAGRLEHTSRSQGVAVREVEYAARATLRVAVSMDDVPALEATIAQLTDGQAACRVAGTDWVDASRLSMP